MDWNTLPLAARIGVCYLAGCALLTLCFGAEWALDWWDRHITRDKDYDIGEYSALEDAAWKDRR